MITDTEIATLVAEARRAIDDSGKSRETVNAAISAIRSEMAEIKAATDRASIEAGKVAVGSEADFRRAYLDDASRGAVLDWAPGSDLVLGDRLTHVGRKGMAEPVRFIGGRDDVGQFRFGVLDDPAPAMSKCR
jgi:hypothetical protein